MHIDNMVVGVGGPCFRQKLERITLKQHYGLRMFQRADEIIDYVFQNQPRLIVADYRLPEIDGLSFLYRVRRMAPDSIRILCGVDATTQGFTSAALNLFACIDASADIAAIAEIVDRALPNISHLNEDVLLSNIQRIDKWHAPLNASLSTSTSIQ